LAGIAAITAAIFTANFWAWTCSSGVKASRDFAVAATAMVGRSITAVDTIRRATATTRNPVDLKLNIGASVLCHYRPFERISYKNGARQQTLPG
jgi:hypothetical protein